MHTREKRKKTIFNTAKSRTKWHCNAASASEHRTTTELVSGVTYGTKIPSDIFSFPCFAVWLVGSGKKESPVPGLLPKERNSASPIFTAFSGHSMRHAKHAANTACWLSAKIFFCGCRNVAPHTYNHNGTLPCKSHTRRRKPHPCCVRTRRKTRLTRSTSAI